MMRRSIPRTPQLTRDLRRRMLDKFQEHLDRGESIQADACLEDMRSAQHLADKRNWILGFDGERVTVATYIEAAQPRV